MAVAGCSIAKCGQAFSLFRIPNFIICRIEELAACIHLCLLPKFIITEPAWHACISMNTSEVRSSIRPEASVCCLRGYHHSRALMPRALSLCFKVQMLVCSHIIHKSTLVVVRAVGYFIHECAPYAQVCLQAKQVVLSFGARVIDHMRINKRAAH